MSRAQSDRRDLRPLRWKITALITLLATLIVIVFAATAIQLDRQLSDQLLDTELLTQTNRVTRSVSFVDDSLDIDELGDIEDGVIVGVRPEFDVLTIVDEADLWDELPELSDAEEEERVAAIVDDFSDETLAGFLDLEEPIDRDAMEDRVLAEFYEELADEALRSFILDTAAEDGIELEVPTTIYGDRPISDDTAIEAIELVADEGEDGRFELADGLVARGVPIRSGAEIRGAVVAIADTTPIDDDHRSFRNSMIATGLALIGGAAIAAWFVAGRTIRPAAEALDRQERFLADAAHELRTPIAAIRATAESGASAEPDRALARISQLAAGAGQMTDDLLTLARMDADRLSLTFEPVRLDLLVEAAIDGDPAFVLDAEECVVRADPALLERAIVNLLTNARQHGEADAERPAAVSVRGGIVRVEDQGPGLDSATAAQVFERFRSSATSAGHGLGLPLARWLARAHSGDLVVEPSTDRGATFVLTLPVR